MKTARCGVIQLRMLVHCIGCVGCVIFRATVPAAVPDWVFLVVTQISMTSTTMLKATPLNAVHRNAKAKMVDFGGWDMPVQYAGVLAEHHAVRNGAGLLTSATWARSKSVVRRRWSI